MNRYQLIRGFTSHSDAQAYADALPAEARAKVVPYRVDRDRHAFAVDVSRSYTGGRIK
jgi:hypothetical protein